MTTVIGIALALALTAPGKKALLCTPVGKADAARRALEASGYQVVEEASVCREVNGTPTGMANPLDAGGLDASPPARLPKEAKRDWADAMRACRKQVQRPYGLMNPAAMACGREVRMTVWERLADRLGAGLVLQMDPSSATAFVPGEPELQVTLLSSDSGAGEAAKLLISGKGARRPRTVHLQAAGEAPEAAAAPAEPVAPAASPARIPELADGKVEAFPAVAAPKACGALPGALTVEPADAPLVQNLVARYAASVQGQKASEAPLACSLQAEKLPARSGGLMGRMEAVRVVLTCGAERYEAGTPAVLASRAFEDQSTHKSLTKQLVEKLLAARCKAK